MPPKKEKGKKSGKKDKEPKPPEPVEEINELTKEFYNIQIHDLEHRLDRYQAKCDLLAVQNREFNGKFTQLETDKKEIASFLKKNLEQRHEEINDLNDRLAGLQQIKDHEKDRYEAELQKLRTDYQEMKDQLTSENMILGGKLASLEEFKVQREDIMARMASLENEIVKLNDDHKEEIYKIERKQVVDKDRLKKEMVMRVNQVAAEFRKVSNKQMAETTKRTIRENVSINAQLGKMSDKTMELIQENDELRAKEKKNKLQIEVLEDNEKELARKNLSNQKIIRMLTEKCKEYELTLQEYEARYENEDHGLEAEAEMLRQQVEVQREELQAMAKENEHLEQDVARLKQELSEETKNKRKLEQVLREAALAIKKALTTNTSEDVEESESDKIEKRNTMLENLLVLLNSAAALGIGPSPGDMARDRAAAAYSEEPRSISSPFPGSGKGLRRGDYPMSPLAKKFASETAHYKLGDFGIVPRPDLHMQSNREMMKEVSQAKTLGTLKKVMTRSVAVQTVSAPKAMFFADQLLSRYPGVESRYIQQELGKDRLRPQMELRTVRKSSHTPKCTWMVELVDSQHYKQSTLDTLMRLIE